MKHTWRDECGRRVKHIQGVCRQSLACKTCKTRATLDPTLAQNLVKLVKLVRFKRKN